MSAWDQTFEANACALVDRVVAGDAQAWRALMVQIAPHIEAWARDNRLLRRCRLRSEDDARAVMVAVLERLAAEDHANLRKFASRARPETPDDDELVSSLVRLGRLDDDDAEASGVECSDGTRLRAWLLGLVDFVARDHVRHKFGWNTSPGRPSKRDLHTDAAPLEGVEEPSARPPMTDRLTVSRLVAEVHAYMATFPEDMQVALAMWLDDSGVEDIAAHLKLADAARARALVRAGQARLRERFRGRSPLLFA
jgi:hypothetical protein